MRDLSPNRFTDSSKVSKCLEGLDQSFSPRRYAAVSASDTPCSCNHPASSSLRLDVHQHGDIRGLSRGIQFHLEPVSASLCAPVQHLFNQRKTIGFLYFFQHVDCIHFREGPFSSRSTQSLQEQRDSRQSISLFRFWLKRCNQTSTVIQ